jgi:ribosome-binding protein aMBF1 (putative translation factor)
MTATDIAGPGSPTTRPVGDPLSRSHSRRRSVRQRTQRLRSKAGRWLRELREQRGLSQRDLAPLVGAKHYTFISQIESGRCRIPPERYLVWADALGLDPRELVQGLLPYYDPVTYEIIFVAASPGSERSE